jgi:hypothetical protein
MLERLTFNLGTHPPARPSAPEARNPAPAVSAVVSAVSERLDWSYRAMLAFTFVLLARPQDTLPILNPLHLAEVTAILAVLALACERLSRGLPLTRMTPEVAGVIGFALLLLVLVPFSVWPGGSFELLTDIYLKIVIVFILMVNTVTTVRRLERLVWLITIVTGYIAVRAIVDYGRGTNLVEGNRIIGAVGGLFANPNDLGRALPGAPRRPSSASPC